MRAGRGKFGAFSGVLATGVEASKVLDYTGDDANDRVLDLGADYDLVLILERTNRVAVNHLCTAYALRTDCRGTFIYSSSGSAVLHSTGSSSNTYWQGKLSGADANKIKLGTNGASTYGTNASGIDYRVLGLKLA